MNNKKIILFAICTCLILSIVAYEVLNSQLLSGNASDNSDSQPTDSQSTTTPAPSPTSTDNPSPSATTIPSPTPESTDSSSNDNTDTNIDTTTGNEEDHESSADYVYSSSEAVKIQLNSNSIIIDSANFATIDGSVITINSSGTYLISGTLTNGQIIVNSQDEGTVQLILNNVDISCSTSAPIYIVDAKKAVIILEEGSTNTVKDTNTGSVEEPNAAIFSTCDLTIYGSGSLTVQGNNNDAIASKDGLIIKSGTVKVNAVDDGVRGKDYLIIKGGQVTVTSGGDGLKSDNAEDATRGYVSIEGGSISITSGGDAIEAQTDVLVTGGQITETSGGGSSKSSTISTKGIKGLVSVIISSGTFTLNSADDAIHSNGTITISGGTFSISTGDDAIHADSSIKITAGTIDITKSYEGIESVIITITGGNIHIIASDDGINGAGGNDASGFNPGPGGMPGGDMFAETGCYCYINGGYIAITALGDGVDVGGAVTMTAGTLIVNGPVDNGNGALDFTSFKMTGGLLVAVGSSGMAQALTSTSTQYSVLVNFNSAYTAGTLIHIQSSVGTDIITVKPTKQFQSIVVCSPALAKGTTYEIYVGGSCSGTLTDSIYSGGVYTAGTNYTSFTINSVVTSIGRTGFR